MEQTFLKDILKHINNIRKELETLEQQNTTQQDLVQTTHQQITKELSIQQIRSELNLLEHLVTLDLKR
uniref:Uncharacterized protein n=1 Tax=uncultured prokaryote TaxID=198431 RepID=A0A0H5PZ77_9ZZZZ|nr:hypothetical protein [uncultured prokaryote]